MTQRKNILVAGIGGASLGTEILKCLALARDRYAAFGCDISGLAYGHYQEGVEETFVVDRGRYVESVLEVCRAARIDCIVPGGEEPLRLLSAAREALAAAGVQFAANSPNVVEAFTDKERTFERLAALGFDVPRTVTGRRAEDLDTIPLPCVIKPATGSGGSTFVFLAETRKEVAAYVEYLTAAGRTALAQEYVPETEGEFTVGVLSCSDGRLVGSIALRRTLGPKLSVLHRSQAGVISTGYSQGLIQAFPEVCAAAERIAAAVGSQGPMNVQGRVRNGALVPFEINPRFSATTYLRAMAGFNEVDLLLRHLLWGEDVSKPAIRPGYYLRSFCETWVPPDEVRS